MITLKEMLAEPQTMYDGGMVQHMAEGGEPESNLPVPTEEESGQVKSMYDGGLV
jgi:hypothetical protein|tara:strand:- start:7897 stop:8058 length:162 start_codon:yes stop_codon:yes gene_type:complete